jgi:undecaprenyl-diphosphatase
MSELIQSAIMGLIQGLTEFLPVSSSGHLELANALFQGQNLGESSLLMTVTLHAATAFSTIAIFWKDILEILKGLFSFQWNDEKIYSLKIILSMVPAAAVGLIFEDRIEALFRADVLLVGIMLLVTGSLLFLADRARNTNKKVSFIHALIVGVAQAIAIMPGISRSGATISASVLLGIDRERAAKFSFLMVVPLILGKMAKDIASGEISQSSNSSLELIVGFTVAFITGLLACVWMIKLVKNSKLTYFSVYCFIVGGIAIASVLLN